MCALPAFPKGDPSAAVKHPVLKHVRCSVFHIFYWHGGGDSIWFDPCTDVPTAAAPTAPCSAAAATERTRAKAAQQEGLAGLHPWQGIRGG